ncbi:hypothetical protein PQQ86_08895 [Paraburkholderia sediminicola]|uniref:hypothetical protein n=1 Tax=Paraburkholderia sediminicola TaxID=458836 RepID=UPI0038BD0DAC
MTGVNCHAAFRIKKIPERTIRKTGVEMSEYPCTGIDKAVLKFGLQDCKISQNVSVKFSVFFRNFVRQLLPKWRLRDLFRAFMEADVSQAVRFPTKLTPRLSSSFCVIPPDKKITCDFFRVIFLF